MMACQICAGIAATEEDSYQILPGRADAGVVVLDVSPDAMAAAVVSLAASAVERRLRREEGLPIRQDV